MIPVLGLSQDSRRGRWRDVFRRMWEQMCSRPNTGLSRGNWCHGKCKNPVFLGFFMPFWFMDTQGHHSP